MQNRERERLKNVVYQAYMAAKAAGGVKTEKIYENLGDTYHRAPDTMKKWVLEVGKQREIRLKNLEDQMRIIASGDFYPDWETGEPIKTERIGCSIVNVNGEAVLF